MTENFGSVGLGDFHLIQLFRGQTFERIKGIDVFVKEGDAVLREPNEFQEKRA